MISIADRKKIARLVLTTDDDSMIEKIKAIIFPSAKAKNSFIKKYNKEIDEAEKQIKSGKYFTQEEVELLLEEWVKK